MVVVDAVYPDAHADGWVAGPSWAVTTGADLNVPTIFDDELGEYIPIHVCPVRRGRECCTR